MRFNYKDFFKNFSVVTILYLILFLSIMNEGIFSYKGSVYINVLIYIIFAVSLSITVGLLGLLNLGHAGFIAVGAYTGAYVSKLIINLGINENIKFIFALIIAGIVSGIVGVLVAILTQKFSGDYLAIITLAFGEIIKYVIQNLPFLGGAAGFKGIPNYTNFTITFIMAVITISVVMLVGYSRFGRSMVSIRENEIAAENVGININKIKRYGFFISAFFAGIGGALFAHNLGVISPDKFSFIFSIEILVMVVFGGMGSITGAILAAGFITIANEFLRGIAEYRALIYSISLIIIILYRPKGLLGTSEISIVKIIDKIKGIIKDGIIKNKKYGD
ncbi:branched-chain amino acid ABC transporter permease [Oceanivirga miroungae]|uniref:Inner-membrane translocator n=1 Tax=Oceanivirga miroungae TaxID=1130046 RepID=A0A6I8M8D6_9FUSO|nr:branched-chain amino acid ABC transporter permease [Oceanivirga miroungae]VWL85721.1 inner-membrane translocator [Oceanivirga miroungae]